MASRARLWLPQVLGLLVLAGTAAAAVSVTYTGQSVQTLGVKSAPIVFEAGADSGLSDYVAAVSLSTNHTRFTASVFGVPEAVVVIDDLVHVKNADTRAHTVTLLASPDTNAHVAVYRMDVYDGATLVGALDYKALAPGITLTMPAGKTYIGTLTIELAEGAGNDNVADSLTLTTSVRD